MKGKKMPIDFVIAWVDGNDPEWQKEKAYYLRPDEETSQFDASDMRYRDYDNLRYWFRAVEKYAPWVNQVHLITCGHLPEWINPDAPKLHFVRHSDYIPEKYLPTFSSHPIELNLHRIEGLSEQFVYFNDDFFLTAPVKPDDFFVNGLPCDSIEETPMAFSWKSIMNSININDILFASEYFDRKECRKKHWNKWYNFKDPHGAVKNMLMGILNDRTFFGLNIHHLPQAYRKEILEEVWSAAPDLLEQTCFHKFRDAQDVSQCVFKFWQLLTGQFQPYNKRKFGKVLPVEGRTEEICQSIIEQRYKVICMNDSPDIDFETVKSKINHAFEIALPKKSSFEK